MQLDNAVVMVGSTIEGAAQEMQKVGPEDAPEWKPKYTMKQLLDPNFRLPVEQVETESSMEDFLDFLGSGHIGNLKYDEVG